jgi:hypothetical protein
MVIFEVFDAAGRVLRVHSEHVGRQTAFLLEIETADHGIEIAALCASEVLMLGRALAPRPDVRYLFANAGRLRPGMLPLTRRYSPPRNAYLPRRGLVIHHCPGPR